MKKPVVLILEDDQDIFDYLTILLSDMNIEILRASNGVEAFQLIDSGRQIDLVLLDVIMPVMDGEEFFSELRSKRNSSVPVILTSVDEANARRMMEIGEVQGVFLKGRSGNELKELINSILR